MEVGTSAFPPLSPSPLPKVSCTYTWAHAMVGHQEFSILCHFTTFVCCIKLSSEEKAGLEHIHPWRYTAGTCFPPGSRQLCLRLFMVLSFWSSPPFWRRIFPPCLAGPSAGWDRSLAPWFACALMGLLLVFLLVFRLFVETSYGLKPTTFRCQPLGSRMLCDSGVSHARCCRANSACKSCDSETVPVMKPYCDQLSSQ